MITMDSVCEGRAVTHDRVVVERSGTHIDRLPRRLRQRDATVHHAADRGLHQCPGRPVHDQEGIAGERDVTTPRPSPSCGRRCDGDLRGASTGVAALAAAGTARQTTMAMPRRLARAASTIERAHLMALQVSLGRAHTGDPRHLNDVRGPEPLHPRRTTASRPRCDRVLASETRLVSIPLGLAIPRCQLAVDDERRGNR